VRVINVELPRRLRVRFGVAGSLEECVSSWRFGKELSRSRTGRIYGFAIVGCGGISRAQVAASEAFEYARPEAVVDAVPRAMALTRRKPLGIAIGSKSVTPETPPRLNASALSIAAVR
jgi:hypothetical protein